MKWDKFFYWFIPNVTANAWTAAMSTTRWSPDAVAGWFTVDGAVVFSFAWRFATEACLVSRIALNRSFRRGWFIGWMLFTRGWIGNPWRSTTAIAWSSSYRSTGVVAGIWIVKSLFGYFERIRPRSIGCRHNVIMKRKANKIKIFKSKR